MAAEADDSPAHTKSVTADGRQRHRGSMRMEAAPPTTGLLRVDRVPFLVVRLDLTKLLHDLPNPAGVADGHDL